MNLHEYQAKQLFADYGISVPQGSVASTPSAAGEAASLIGGDRWVVKAQVHAGGRGKAGGVKLVDSKAEVEETAKAMLGTNLVTFQTDENGQPVNSVLVEEVSDIARELYLGAVVDRAAQRVIFMASTEGGMDIEEVAENSPEKILQAIIDPMVGLQPYQARKLAFGLGLDKGQIKQFNKLVSSLA
ncbi:MAG: acetate--CoA ligase family protein, partial [Immundisolibacteraceae bacterium]|nr:acetate--CoA ligase family protein [Immundisolibacteraceae bacterium]